MPCIVFVQSTSDTERKDRLFPYRRSHYRSQRLGPPRRWNIHPQRDGSRLTHVCSMEAGSSLEMARELLLWEVGLHKNAQAGTPGVNNASVLTMFSDSQYK